MRQARSLPASAVAVLVMVAAGSLHLAPAGAATKPPAHPPAPCKKGDTSGSCRLQEKKVVIVFPSCPRGKHPCNPTVIHLKHDANHPFDMDIVVPSPTGGVPSKQAHPQAGVFSVLIPEPMGSKSIQAGDYMDVTEDPSGAFSLIVTDKKGHKLALWAPPLKLVPPKGDTALQTMTRAGWKKADPNRVQTPGLYRWVKR